MVSKSSGLDDLVLGWRMLPDGTPSYWLQRSAKPGGQSVEEMVSVPAESMANHTVIIAQSGSGKSFFLGRIVEELLLKTRARCLILDSNADFRKVDEAEDPALWSSASYDLKRRIGKLPHESSRKEFQEQWSEIKVQVLTNGWFDEDKHPNF